MLCVYNTFTHKKKRQFYIQSHVMWCGIYTNKSYGVAVSIRDTTNRCNEYNTKFVYKWNKVRGMGVELYPNAGKVYYGHHSEAKKS